MYILYWGNGFKFDDYDYAESPIAVSADLQKLKDRALDDSENLTFIDDIDYSTDDVIYISVVHPERGQCAHIEEIEEI